MATPENSFISGVHSRYLDPLRLYWMKNHNAYVGGIADCWYSGKARKSRDLWIEYKFIKVPARDTTIIKPELSPLQVEWLTSRKEEGRHVAVVVGCKEGAVVLTPAQWESITTGVFRQALQTRRALAEFITNFVNCT